MAEYEVVREVQNLCANNQMRDVFFDEIETDDPVEWIRREVKGKEVNLTVDRKADGSMTIYVESAGVSQKFLFTPATGRCARQFPPAGRCGRTWRLPASHSPRRSRWARPSS